MTKNNDIFEVLDNFQIICDKVSSLLNCLAGVMGKTSWKLKTNDSNFLYVESSLNYAFERDLSINSQSCRVDIINLNNVSCNNIKWPKIEEFDLRKLKTLPTGVDFLKMFMNRSSYYLKRKDIGTINEKVLLSQTL